MNNNVSIDPILLRDIEQESWSLRTAFINQFAAVDCSNVPKDEMLQGGDVSHWQGRMNWNQYFDNGMNYTIIRAMINGEPDNEFDYNANTLTEQGRWFGTYGATGYPTLANALPYARALADLVKGVGNLCVWWDVEAKGLLTTEELSKYTSEVMGELGVLLPGTILEIYTRQSFWDSNISPGNWAKYPLAAARYNKQLTCPWSDGYYVFRDWDYWRYWQISATEDGKYYGAESSNIDMLLFNGNENTFKEVYNLDEVPPPPDCCDELQTDIELLAAEIYSLRTDFEDLHKEFDEHSHPEETTMWVEVIDESLPLGIAVDHDKKCEGQEPSGKPTIEHPEMSDRIIYTQGDKIEVYKRAKYSCKDDVNTPTILGAGREEYYIAVDGYEDQVSFVKAALVTEIS